MELAFSGFIFLAYFVLKHSEHSVGYHKTANDIYRGGNHGDYAQNRADSVVLRACQNNRADY